MSKATATLYDKDNYKGQHVDVIEDISDLSVDGFNEKLSSVIVKQGSFTLYEHADYEGYNVTIDENGGPGHDGKYPTADSIGGHNDKYTSIEVND